MKVNKKELIESIKATYQKSKVDYDRDWAVIQEHSLAFKNFWENKIMNSQHKLLTTEIDEVVKLIDVNAKGNSKQAGDVAVALCFVRQTTWVSFFQNIKSDKELRLNIDTYLKSTSPEEKTNIMRYFEENMSSIAGLGDSFITLNAIFYLWDPFNEISVLSLTHRETMMEALSDSKNYQSKTDKNRGYLKDFKEFFKELDTEVPTFSIVRILYQTELKDSWALKIDPYPPHTEPEDNDTDTDEQTFALEKYLEEFILTNWKSIKAFSSYTLVKDDKGNVGQYPAKDSGRIDILAQDKDSNYLVIELKKAQSSDKTVGQTLRYIGWVQKNLVKKNESVKGMIICTHSDNNLDLALHASKADIEVQYYKLNFELNSQKE